MSLILVADKVETRRDTLIDVIESTGRTGSEITAGSAEGTYEPEDFQPQKFYCIGYGDGSTVEDNLSDPLSKFTLAVLSTDLEPNGIELLKKMRSKGDDGLKQMPVIIASTKPDYDGKPIEEVVREFGGMFWDYKDINQLRAMVKQHSYEVAR